MKSVVGLGVCAVLAALTLPSGAEAGAIKLGWKKDRQLCLDYDNRDTWKSTDYDAHGGNVTAHPCHGHSNQNWTVDGKIISVNYGGQRYCLDFNRGDIVRKGANPAHNVIGWSDCHGASIQQWTRVGNTLRVNWNGKEYCLDAVVGQVYKDYPEGPSYNVTATTHCHGGAHQQWFVD